MKSPLKLFTIIACFICQFIYAQPNEEFDPGCVLPFQSIAVSHPIDNNCGIKGQGTVQNGEANRLQNSIKNNFCATGTVTNVTVTSLVNLHKKVKSSGITYGTPWKVPLDRTFLQSLGEGTRVRFTGYINNVKYANTDKGEGVNCKKSDEENNDVHIELTTSKNQSNACKRISAEISPHFRPMDWNVDKLKDVKDSELKIRITGQLFFDASHTACADNTSGGYRASSWEIHPVYRIEVFLGNEWLDLHDVIFPHEDE